MEVAVPQTETWGWLQKQVYLHRPHVNMFSSTCLQPCKKPWPLQIISLLMITAHTHMTTSMLDISKHAITRFVYREGEVKDFLDEVRGRNGAEHSLNAILLLLHVRLLVELNNDRQGQRRDVRETGPKFE